MPTGVIGQLSSSVLHGPYASVCQTRGDFAIVFVWVCLELRALTGIEGPQKSPALRVLAYHLGVLEGRVT